MPRNRLLKRQFSIHKDAAPDAKPPGPDALPVKTLTPSSTGAVNSMNGRGSAATKLPAPARSATIRSVPSFEASDSSPDSRRSPFSSSVNSTASASSAMAPSLAHDRSSDSSSPAVRLKGDGHETPVKWNAGPRPAPHDSSPLSPDAPDADAAAAAAGPGHWDSTIGKAGLGKTGRVINKLVSDNDALKRDIQIERLRADEAKQAARLIEDKMERLVSDYEGRLLEASVTKTLLTRKERQVETLTATVEAEKKKAAAALEREKSWRLELDKVRADSALQIDEATAYAQLMEGRYNAISSHWRDQGDDVRRALAKMRGDVGAIVDERRADDDKIRTLRDLCDQQDANIRQLRRDKDDMARLFDRYRQTQDDDLRDIKATARQRELEQARLLDESRQALDKLRWALNVKKNVRDAQ
ncbi:hypothetical protein CDD83_7857 [Cordyceps sp. RAO-2017]|nr:hypothetical protein CDD83_7857 [Cordyceps sp. RAO-2017]